MSAETEFQHRLEKLLDERYIECRDQLAQGICLQHPEPIYDYASRAGYLRAISNIGEMIKEIAKQMNGKTEGNINGF